MEGSSVIDGKVYAFHVKVSEKLDWTSNDIAYGVVYQGNDGLSFSQFKFICETLNKKKFLSKRANMSSDETCTWVEVQSTLEAWPKVGKPGVVSVDSPITFYGLARTLYDHGYFTDPDGLLRLNKAAGNSSKPDSSHLSGKLSSAKDMIEQAKNNSVAVHKNISSVATAGMSQGARQLAGIHTHLHDSDTLDDNQSVHDNTGGLGGDVDATNADLKSKIEEYKGRLAAAEEKFATQCAVTARKDTEIEKLKSLLDQTKSELVIARSAQTSFMAENDKNALENKKLTDGTTMDIINGLRPFLKQELTCFVSALDPTSSKITALKDTCDNLSKSVDSLLDIVPNSFELVDSQLVAMMDTTSDSLESVSEKIEKLHDSLPTSSSSSPPPPVEKKPAHPGPCNYQVNDSVPGNLI